MTLGVYPALLPLDKILARVDGDFNGITSTLNVPDEFLSRTVSLQLTVNHPQVRDLSIILRHGDTQAAIWQNQPGTSGRSESRAPEAGANHQY